jgi:hypothetical protein
VGSPETKSPTVTTQPTNQKVVAGGSVTFTVAASGSGPLNYQWFFNGSAISGATATNYILTGVMAANAGNYRVVITNLYGSVTSSVAALTVTKATGTITLGNLNRTYNGSAEAATASTTPSGLAVNLTYNGSANPPTNAGSYTVIGTINDANYQGSATNTLVINKASGAITFGGLNQTYTGTARAATAGTTPSGLAVNLTYNGSANAPINAGSYTVIGTINNANYQGSATNSLVINKVTLTITADNKTKIYGMPNPPLTASYSGFVGADNTNALSLPVVLSTTATNTSAAGTYPITVGGATAANYMIQYVDGTLRVISAPQLASATTSVNGTQRFIVSWQTITNQTYQLEYTDNLGTFIWTPVGTPFAGTDGIVAVTNAMKVMPNCFFRVEVLETQ